MEQNFIRDKKKKKKKEKKNSNFLIFKAQIKEKLLSTDNELDYFQIQEVNKKQPKTAYIFAFKGAW